MAFPSLTKTDCKEAQCESAGLLAYVGRGRAGPAIAAKLQAPGRKVPNAFLTSAVLLPSPDPGQLSETSALCTCKSQWHLMGMLCTQNWSVMSETVVYLFIYNKCFLNYPGFLRG